MSTPDEGAGSGSSPAQAPWYEGAAGWLPLSRAFIDRELIKPAPDYRSLADRLAPYLPAERHAGWIGIAQSAPSRMARTRAYIEALHHDPDPTSVAWSWLDGDFDLIERVEHVLSPDDEHTPATVEALRDRIGAIIDVGDADMPAETAVNAAETVSNAEPTAGPDATQPAAAETAAMSEAERAAKSAGGADAAEPASAAEPTGPEPTAAAATEESFPSTPPATQAADEAWAGLTAEPGLAEAAQPAPVESPGIGPVAGPAAGSPAPAAAAQVVQPAGPAYWSPTHYVPADGMAAWDYPDPSRPPRVVLNAGVGVVIDGIAGDWAFVRAVNGWRGWVDGRRLTTRP